MIHILNPENFNFVIFLKAFFCTTGVCLISTHTQKINLGAGGPLSYNVYRRNRYQLAFSKRET